MPSETLSLPVIASADEDIACPELQLRIQSKFHSPFTGSTLLFAETQKGLDVVAKFSVYPKGCDHEWRALEIVKELGDEVQQPLWKVESKTLGKGIVTRYVSSKTGQETLEEKHRIHAGNTLRKVHALPNISADSKWTAKQNLSEYTYIFEKAQRTGANELSLNGVALPLLRVLQQPVTHRLNMLVPVLCHQDLYDDQLLLQPNKNVTIIDFENWAPNDPLIDLSYYIFHSARLDYPAAYASAILSGYQSEKYDEEQRASLAFYALAIAIRSACYFQGKSNHFFASSLHALNQVVQSIDSEWLWKI